MRKLKMAVVTAAILASAIPALAQEKTIGLVVARTGDPVFAMMECGARKAAKEEGYEITVSGPAEWNAQQQIPVLRALIASKPQAIVIDPTDSVAEVVPPGETVWRLG